MSVAIKKNPKLRESAKKQVMNSSVWGKPWQWSAIKAMRATKIYKEKWGEYSGSTSWNSLKKRQWEDWKTKSGKPSKDTWERFLPAKAIKSLSSAEYKKTSDAKKKWTAEGKQFVKQPKSIAKKTAKFR